MGRFLRLAALPLLGVLAAVPGGAAHAQAGYGGMPPFCLVNHQARGAAIGAMIGRARAGERGAEIGAAIGARRGARADALCRRIAYRRAMALAMRAPAPPPRAAAAYPAAPAARPYAAAPAAPYAAAPAPYAAAPATQQAAPYRPVPAAAPQPAPSAAAAGYTPIEYVTPSNRVRHAITPLSSYTDPSTHERCMVSSEVSFAPDGTRSAPVTGRVCETADGRFHEM